MKDKRSVIIIGAGPVGSYLAYRLSRSGYGVVVLERKGRLGERVCCSGIIGQECVDSFAIDDSVILRRVNSAGLFSPSGKLLRLQRQETQACIVDRAAFDIAMYHRARDMVLPGRITETIPIVFIQERFRCATLKYTLRESARMARK